MKYAHFLVSYCKPDEVIEFIHQHYTNLCDYYVSCNGPGDYEKLKKCNYHNVHAIESDNKGYFNSVLSVLDILKADYSHYVVSNFDLSYDVNDLINLLHRLENSSDIFGASGMIFTDNGSSQNPHLLKRPSLLDYQLRKICHEKLLYPLFIFIKLFNSNLRHLMFEKRIDINTLPDEIDCYSLHGSFLIFNQITHDQLRKVFSHDLFLFGEEIHIAELSCSLNKRLVVFPEFVIKHHENATTGSIFNEWRRKYMLESYIWVINKFYSDEKRH